MGFKSSMITISNLPAQPIDERRLLDSLGYTNYAFVEETTLEACMYPCDQSMNIGYYNNHLVICDDYLCTDQLERWRRFETLTGYEQALTALYPGSEILTTACHSGVNYHLYSLVYRGVRLRYKRITSDDAPVAFGNLLAEEAPIYERSTLVDGQRLFKSDFDGADGAYEYTEDQLMEDFTFGVARRHLGVKISTGEDEELTFNTPFKKYKAVPTVRAVAPAIVPAAQAPTPPAAGGSWLSKLLKRWGPNK